MRADQFQFKLTSLAFNMRSSYRLSFTSSGILTAQRTVL